MPAFRQKLHLHVTTLLLLLLLLVLAAGTVGADAAPGESAAPIAATSSNTHLWYVVPAEADPDRYDLMLHASAMTGPYHQRTLPVTSRPAAMAAWQGRLWLLSPAREVGDRWQHDVYSLRATRRVDLEVYATDPPNRFELSHPLPARTDVLDLTAGDRGVYALLAPERGGQKPTLMHKQNNRWATVELPEELAFTPATRLALDGSRRDRINLLTQDPNDPQRTLWHSRGTDEQWQSRSLPVELLRIAALTSVDGRLIAALHGGSEGEPRIQLSYPRDGRLVLLTEFATPRGFWSLHGMEGGVVLLNYSTRDAASMQVIDPITGEIGERHPFRSVPLPVGRLWHMALMLTLAVLAVLIVVLIRPGDAAAVSLPRDHVAASPTKRMIALVLDLLPGAIVALLVMRVSPIELLRLPIVTDRLELAAPFLIMIGVATVLMTLGEGIWQASPGKALLGLRVFGHDGKPPTFSRVLIRNAVRIMILIVPPLAVFALLSPHLQGFNDLLARTVVLRPLDEEERSSAKADASERGGRGDRSKKDDSSGEG